MEQVAQAAPGDARFGYFFEDLELGMSAEYGRIINDEEMRLFADLTGDTNPAPLRRRLSPSSRASAAGSSTACAPQH